MEPQCGDYCPTGVLGLEKGGKLADIAIEHVISGYFPYNYNSSGPFMLRNAIKLMDLANAYNAPYYYFYPLNSSKDVGRLYEGKFSCHPESYCVHWFGGHPLSQKFNRVYTPEFSKSSRDFISVYLRGVGVI